MAHDPARVRLRAQHPDDHPYRRVLRSDEQRDRVRRGDECREIGPQEPVAEFSKEAAALLLEAGIIRQIPDLSKLADTRFIK